MLVESFFDQIYEDLEPFWGLDPADIRNSLADWKWTLRVRNGKVKNIPQGRFRSRVWGDMLQKVAGDLPDMDIAINPLDESRVFVPWSKIDALMKQAGDQRERMMALPPNQMLSRSAQPLSGEKAVAGSHKWFKRGSLWSYILETCPPSSREIPSTNITTPTANWTISKDICSNHHWAQQHGSLLKPATLDITTSLLPLFSAAKLQGSNDILLPPPSYYTGDALFTGKGWFGDGKTSVPWHKKLHSLIWRGKATGGLIHESTYRTSHRQNLVSMLNASDTPSHCSDASITRPTLNGNPTSCASLQSWLASTADAGLTDTMCSSSTPLCAKMSFHFSTLPPIPMKTQYKHKYLPDLDGNSLSGRFRAFLLSNSAPMKATIFKEWHDSRLMPWVHFVPLDIELKGLWSTMAYFLGFPDRGGGVVGHDEEGERIATEGREWAETVLRREDMELYLLRVLLEFARVSDDERGRLGFVEDLRSG